MAKPEVEDEGMIAVTHTLKASPPPYPPTSLQVSYSPLVITMAGRCRLVPYSSLHIAKITVFTMGIS